MPVPIQASPLNSSSANVLACHNTYHFHHLGAIWNITAFPVLSNRQPQIWKSTDNAATWVEQDALNEPIGQLSMFWDGVSDILYFSVRGATGHTIQLYSFSMLTGLYLGALGTASPAFTILFNNPNGINLVRYSDGTFRVFYQVPTSGDLHYMDFDGVSTWGADTLLLAADTSSSITQIVHDSDVTHLIMNIGNSLTGWHYLRVDQTGTLTNNFNFPDSIASIGPNTGSDGQLEGTTLAWLATLSANNEVVIYRGSPITNPTWAAAESVDNSNNSQNTPTLVIDNSGNEVAFWLSFDDNFIFESTSTIRTSTHSGGVWSAQATYYSIALNPFSDPDPANCHNDNIYNLGVEWAGGQAWVQFDGVSNNFSPPGSQPNFAFSVPSPACSLSSSVSGGIVTLTWTTTNTPTSASIDQGIGAVNPAGGSLMIPLPGVTTTYILTVSNANGTSTCNTTVTITPPSCTPVPACPEEPVIISHDQPCEALGS